MPDITKFNCFSRDLATKKHDLSADVFKLMLTPVLPVAANSVYSDVSAGELATGFGYTAGGQIAVNSGIILTGAVTKWNLQNPLWTFTGAAGTFRYAILYNATQTSPLYPLIGWYDYGSVITPGSGDTFTETFNAAGVLTVT